nr:hypothetical protein [Tanacetum cinerariifolium]
MSFEISFTDALILMPKFASTLKALIGNKEKLSEMARTPMNEHCSAVILNKLPRKLGDPGKFLIPCEFPGIDEYLALADLGANINLMPLSIWEGLSLSELTLTCMTLKLVNRSVSKPIGIAKYDSVKERREKSLSSRKSHDTGASYVMVMDSMAILDVKWIMKYEHMAWQIDYCIIKEGMYILRGRKSVPGRNSSEREMERGSWKEIRIRSPDRLLSFPSGFPFGMVPPKNLDERKCLVPHDSILTIQNSLRKKKEDDMGACIEKFDKVGLAAQDPMYDTVLLLFGQSADYRKLWLHLKPESCGNWVKSVGNNPRVVRIGLRVLEGRFGKLHPRADGPFRILKKINDNAYKVELPDHYGVSDTFNVADLSPYMPNADFDDDSGSSHFLEGDDDTDQGGSPLSPTQAGPLESNSSGNVDMNAKIDNLSVRMQQSSLPYVNKDIRVSTMTGRTFKGARDTTTSSGELPVGVMVNPSSSLGDTNVGAVRASKNPNAIYGYPKPFSMESSILGFDGVSRVSNVKHSLSSVSHDLSSKDASNDDESSLLTSHWIMYRVLVGTDKVFDGVNISIPHKVVEKVSLHLENTLYGYFIGKRMAFLVVEYYVRNNWVKYGLKRIMMNAKGFFFFKFDSRVGLDASLEGGPWMIHNSPIILKKWSMNTSLHKEELTCISIWVKLHDVPIQVFEEDGIPDLEGPGHTKETIRVEYEWKPPRCPTCNIFGHTGETCPGVSVSKGFQVGKEFKYQPKAYNVGSNGNTGTCSETNPKAGPSKNTNDTSSLITKGTNDRQQDTGKKKISNIASPNPFAALEVDDNEKEENDDFVDVMIMAQTNQIMHLNLVGQARLMRNRPWVLLGDFNTALNLEDHSVGGYEPNAAMREFKECVQAIEPYRISDHSPCILRIPTMECQCKGMCHVSCCEDVKGAEISFHKLLHNRGNLHERVNKIWIELDEAQKAIDRDLSSSILREEHAHYLLAFKEAQLDEEHFLKQKAKIEWLKACDSNTAYFHKIVKSKCARDRKEMFLRAEGVTIPLDDHDLFTCVLDDAKADFMVRDGSNDEVKSVIFSMRDDRALGPNGFTESMGCGVLPVRYLGVPLISSRLLYHDCKILVEKLESRVNDWRNKFISFAGRLQLILPVLSSMHIYWPSVFILPNRIMHDLEQLMRGFLWFQGEMKKRKAKVAWDSVCMPKHEGGLGSLYGLNGFIRISLKVVVSRMFLVEDMFSNRNIARSGFSLDEVWSKVYVLCGMDSIPPRLIDVTTFITPISKGKTAVSILSRLVLAATSYYI